MNGLARNRTPPRPRLLCTHWQWCRVGRIWEKSKKYKVPYLVHFSREKNWFYSRKDGEIAIGVSGVVEGF